MAWTEEQQGLLNQPFSYGVSGHRALLEEKSAEFQPLKEKMQVRNKRIGISLIAGYATSIFGPNFIIMHSSSVVYLGLGAYLFSCLPENKAYTQAFNEMQALYDWCIPDGSNLPPFTHSLTQQLVETMGTLVDKERLQRLSPLINGLNERASLGAYAAAGGQALFGAAKGWLTGGDNKIEQALMSPEVFSLFVRQLVQGKSVSSLDYYLYGKGRLVIEGYADKGVALLPAALKDAFNHNEPTAETNSSKLM